MKMLLKFTSTFFVIIVNGKEEACLPVWTVCFVLMSSKAERTDLEMVFGKFEFRNLLDGTFCSTVSIYSNTRHGGSMVGHSPDSIGPIASYIVRMYLLDANSRI
jgi:hypothetical protein